MASPQTIQRDSQSIAASSFARSLNILVKYARLYGMQHRLVGAQVETASAELKAALPAAGDSGILLGIANGKLLLDGVPLESGAAERGFAQLLTAGGIASIHFSPGVEPGDLARFVSAFAAQGTKPAAVVEQLQAALGNGQNAPIRINQVRFVAQDEGAQPGHVATLLTARALDGEAESIRDWVTDPQRLLQLIAAAQGANVSSVSSATAAERSATPGNGTAQAGAASGAGDSGTSTPASAAAAMASEQDILSVIRLLSGFSQQDAKISTATAQHGLAELPSPAKASLREALAAVAATLGDKKVDDSVLMKISEHLAIRFALERYERGEVRVNAVRELLERLAREMDQLRKILAAHEQAMGRAGMVVESHADILDRQFWAAMPEAGKRGVLLSDDAWCVPGRNVAQYVHELLERGQGENAAAILHAYAGCARNPEPEARRKAAIGVSEMAELYARVPGKLTEFCLHALATQLGRESEPDLQRHLSAAFIRLAQESGARRHLPGVRQALMALDDLARSQPELAETMRPRLGVEMRLRDFIEEAMHLTRVPEPLLDILHRTPDASMGQIISEFERCGQRNECERLVEMAEGIGAEGIKHLRDLLSERIPSEGARAVGLLSRLDPETLAQHLVPAIGAWNRSFQDVAVRQIAAAGASGRGLLLMRMLESLDPLVVPEALDEIGVTGEAAAVTVVGAIAAGERMPQASPFIRIKAIEALGRLRQPQAIEPLLHVLKTKHWFRWTYPRELRIAAMQALASVEPKCATDFLRHSGLRREELEVAPLQAGDETSWTRQRRYPRVAVDKSLPALATTRRHSSGLDIRSLSLGGGLATTETVLPSSVEASLQLRPGLRPIHAHVLVRDAGRKQVAFEIIDMDLQERGRLRGLLSQLNPAAPKGGAQPARLAART